MQWPQSPPGERCTESRAVGRLAVVVGDRSRLGSSTLTEAFSGAGIELVALSDGRRVAEVVSAPQPAVAGRFGLLRENGSSTSRASSGEDGRAGRRGQPPDPNSTEARD